MNTCGTQVARTEGCPGKEYMHLYMYCVWYSICMFVYCVRALTNVSLCVHTHTCTFVYSCTPTFYMCMHVHLHIHMSMCIYTCPCAYTHAHVHIHMHARGWAPIIPHGHTQIFGLYMCMYVCMHMCVYAGFVYTYNTRINTKAHCVYMHIHTGDSRLSSLRHVSKRERLKRR